MISRLAIKFFTPYEWWSNALPPRQENASNARGGGVLKLRFDWYITIKWSKAKQKLKDICTSDQRVKETAWMHQIRLRSRCANFWKSHHLSICDRLSAITSPSLCCFCNAFWFSFWGGDGEGIGAGDDSEPWRFTMCLIRVFGDVLRGCVSRGLCLGSLEISSAACLQSTRQIQKNS